MLRVHAEEREMLGIPMTWADLFKTVPAFVTGEMVPDEAQDGDDGDWSMGSWLQPKAAGHGPWRSSRSRELGK